MKADARRDPAPGERRLTWDELGRALEGRQPARIEAPGFAWAAVALILRGADFSQELLFIRRAEHAADPWSGQVGFPGGRAEPGDRNLAETAVRETREETGLDLVGCGRLLGRLDDIQALARMQRLELAIAPFVFRLEDAPEHKPNEEVTSIHWVPVSDLLDGANRSEMEYPHDGVPRCFPCLRLDGLVVWGLTYRMLEGFAHLLG